MKRKMFRAFCEKTKSELLVGHNKMKHKVMIDESQRQLIILALARLADEKPGWENALEVTAMCFPEGYELFKEFQAMQTQMVLDAIGSIGDKTKDDVPF